MCEMKHTLHPYKLSKKDDEELQQKKAALLGETGVRHAIHITMVTTYGLADGGYRASVQSEVMLDDLFIS